MGRVALVFSLVAEGYGTKVPAPVQDISALARAKDGVFRSPIWIVEDQVR